MTELPEYLQFCVGTELVKPRKARRAGQHNEVYAPEGSLVYSFAKKIKITVVKLNSSNLLIVGATYEMSEASSWLGLSGSWRVLSVVPWTPPLGHCSLYCFPVLMN